MAGYAARARITNAAPHPVVRGAPAESVRAEPVQIEETAVEELTGRPFLAPLTDWWEDVREIWRQSMDVLRDPRIY